MDINWCLYICIVINCAYCVAKPVSLNEVIAAESQQKHLIHAVSSKLEEPVAERFSLNKSLKPLLRIPKKFMITENTLGKKLASLKNKKAFQINSPLRLNRIKHSLRRNKRKNLSLKNEISGNEKLNEKYIPLLRNLGMLFDNLLGAEPGESDELSKKRKRVRYYTETGEFLCPCSSKHNSSINSQEATATSTKATIFEDSSPAQTSPKKTHTLAISNLRSLKQNKRIPLLLPGNTFSRRRDNNGLYARSRTPYHWSHKGDISRNNGNSQSSTRDRKLWDNAKNDQKDTYHDSRHSASSFRPWGRLRIRNTTNARALNDKTTLKADENENSLGIPRRHISKFKRKDKQQVRDHKTKSTEFLSAPIGELRGYVSTPQVDIPQSEPETEDFTTQTYADVQRLTERSSEFTKKDQETSTRHEAVNLNNIPTNPPVANTGTTGSVVFIIDGYSVTRNKNGEKKLKEKAIHIQSK